jgi:ATP-binding cassette subfamily B multidrug efflux pump
MVIITTADRLNIPILIGVYTLDKAVKAKDINMLYSLVAIIAVLYILSYIANILRIRWMNELGQNVITI